MASDLKELSRSLDAAALLELLSARPRILALGEPTHGEDALLAVRNRLFRQLVEREGFRTIALESDCLRAPAVDAYVTTGEGTLDQVMEDGFSHDWGAYAGNRDLVRWMRTHNEHRPPGEHVRFAGFDGPLEITAASSPRPALLDLHTLLAAHVDPGLLPCTAETLDRLLGDDGRWTDPDAMMDPGRSVGRSADACELRLLADDLAALLDAQAPRLTAAMPPDVWDRARLNARTATGLLRYHHAMADPSPVRMTRLCALRDLMMAQNLLALAERGPVLVAAHNSHLQRPKSSMTMWQGRVEWWSAGALVDAALGPGYAVVATAVGTLRHRGVDAPPPETVEGLLYGLIEDAGLVDVERLTATLGDPPPRVSPWFGYAPLAPAHLTALDGLVYVKDVVQGT
ncbi:erythromycin esterase family protein [Streptomyces sp. NPDC004562]|uniref:erythromycin esterase family protein n=1 Tax=Streptomyces sp. NPDC004562 TaxID=3364703 RepID=UPI0036C1BBB4